MAREEEKLRWWWFESHKTSKHSPWLHSTLAELDAKTEEMLRLIEGNADSFAQRAETYYKRRPELISVVEDFYRAHRSLAERHDHLKSSETLSLSRSSKLLQDAIGSTCDTNSPTNSEFEEYADSEIEDPELENASFSPPKELETLKCVEENCRENETWKLQQEMSKLVQESESLRGQLLQKDEEKRDVIRQLALTVETLKDENLRLKRRLLEESMKKRSVLGFQPIERFLGKLVQTICDGKKIV